MIKVACALILKGNKLLITQNTAESDHPFQWEFPGGKLKDDEKAAACIYREIKEELDIEISVLKEMAPVEFDYRIKQIVLIPFLCSIKAGKLKLNEHHDSRWITMEEIDGIDFSEADKELLNQNNNRKLLKKYLRK